MNNYRSPIVGLVTFFVITFVCLGQTTPFDVGIKVGQKIRPFTLPDQKGVIQQFASLKGSKGVVLLFFRSADW